MENCPTILITGAAGNLGSLLARHLLRSEANLRLMVHKTPLPEDLRNGNDVVEVKADLGDKESVRAAVASVDVVIHFAGLLFAPRPAKFLPETNTRWFTNLVECSLDAGVKRIILISFPHVEGPTSPGRPARGSLDRNPVSIHAQTRLQEERVLFELTEHIETTPVVLRLGMVYGPGILMIEAARWLARHRLLAVWSEPTSIHLISTTDFLAATSAAALRPGVQGIYHVCDEEPVTLQHFLDEACRVWKLSKPRRLPLWAIYAAAYLCELQACVLGTPAPLTRDFITIGRVSYCGDAQRARSELISTLKYPSLDEGLGTLLEGAT